MTSLAPSRETDLLVLFMISILASWFLYCRLLTAGRLPFFTMHC
jgi:hypothetical protein